MTAADYPFEDSLMSLVYLAAFLGLYFASTIVAHERKVTNLGSIAVINVFLGWTLVGWVVALAIGGQVTPTRASRRGCEVHRHPSLPELRSPDESRRNRQNAASMQIGEPF